ncbi:acetyl-CoA carboxylase biotin carboxyl carrier protein subunit [Thermodesulfobacteriota bacterium]
MNKEKKRLQVDDAFYETEIPERFSKRPFEGVTDPYKIRAVIPGTVTEVKVRQGQKVTVGQIILILEAMKMYNNVETTIEGRIAEITVSAGDRVEKGQLMVRIED